MLTLYHLTVYPLRTGHCTSTLLPSTTVVVVAVPSSCNVGSAEGKSGLRYFNTRYLGI